MASRKQAQVVEAEVTQTNGAQEVVGQVATLTTAMAALPTKEFDDSRTAIFLDAAALFNTPPAIFTEKIIGGFPVVISDDQTRVQAIEIQKRVKAAKQNPKLEALNTAIKAADIAHSFLCSIRNAFVNPLDTLYKTFGAGVGKFEYDEAERIKREAAEANRKRQEEIDRKQREQEEKARIERERQEKEAAAARERAAAMARKFGDEEQAKEIEQAPLPLPEIEVAPPPELFVPPVARIEPTVSRQEGTRKGGTWKFRVVNIDAIPREYFVLDESAINSAIRGTKERTNIPGIEVYFEPFSGAK
jgi:hypothetical protein